jgi:hypothetical protein
MRQGNDVLAAQYCPRYGPMVVVNNSFRGGERDLECLDMKNNIRSHRQCIEVVNVKIHYQCLAPKIFNAMLTA